VDTLLPFFHPEPRTAFQGKFSYEYNLAAAILDRQVVKDSFTDEKAVSPPMQEALRKVRVVAHKEWEPLGRSAPNPVTVRLKDGRTFIKDVAVPLGHAQDPWPTEEVRDKYLYNARLVLSREDAQATLEMMEHLEEVGDISELMEVVTFRAKAGGS
jgi:2-methylcitrate dehydratase PrpD